MKVYGQTHKRRKEGRLMYTNSEIISNLGSPFTSRILTELTKSFKVQTQYKGIMLLIAKNNKTTHPVHGGPSLESEHFTLPLRS